MKTLNFKRENPLNCSDPMVGINSASVTEPHCELTHTWKWCGDLVIWENRSVEETGFDQNMPIFQNPISSQENVILDKNRRGLSWGQIFWSDWEDPLQNCACWYLSGQQESEKTQAWIFISCIPDKWPYHRHTSRPKKCFEVFWFHNDMEMEHFCNLKIFHRSDSSFPA